MGEDDIAQLRDGRLDGSIVFQRVMRVFFIGLESRFIQAEQFFPAFAAGNGPIGSHTDGGVTILKAALDMDDCGMLRQQAGIAFKGHNAAAGGNNAAGKGRSLLHYLMLQIAEMAFTGFSKDLRNGFAGF